MNPTVKNRLDYLLVLIILYFFSVGFKTLVFLIVNDMDSIFVQSVDILRFNTEIGLFFFYFKHVPIRNIDNKLEVSKILILMFLWPLSVTRLMSK